MQLSEIVDVARYAIDPASGAEYDALVDSARAGLAESGVCVLEGFVRRDAIDRIVASVAPREASALHKVKQHNVYRVADDPSLGEHHVRNAKETTTSATLGYDHLSDIAELETLYRSPEMIRFVAACLGFDQLHPYEDALSQINVLFYPPGTSLGWHFDNATFTVTLMLAEAEAGADFEYVPFLRTDTDPSYDAVAKVVAGDRSAVKTMRQSPGTLVLFRGHTTIHRVTPVVGGSTRLLATFIYSPTPGTRMLAVNQQTFFGRVVDGIADG